MLLERQMAQKKFSKPVQQKPKQQPPIITDFERSFIEYQEENTPFRTGGDVTDRTVDMVSRRELILNPSDQ